MMTPAGTAAWAEDLSAIAFRAAMVWQKPVLLVRGTGALPRELRSLPEARRHQSLFSPR